MSNCRVAYFRVGMLPPILLGFIGILLDIGPACGQQIPNISDVHYHLVPSNDNADGRKNYATQHFIFSGAKATYSTYLDAPRSMETKAELSEPSVVNSSPADKMGPAAETASDAAADPDRPGGNNDSAFTDRYDLREKRIRRVNRRLEFVYQALNLTDLIETMACLHEHTCLEANPIIGKHPSDAKLIALKSLSGLIHFVVYDKLKNRDSRSVFDFECITIGIQGIVVGLNLRHTF